MQLSTVGWLNYNVIDYISLLDVIPLWQSRSKPNISNRVEMMNWLCVCVCFEQMAHYKIPHYVSFVDSFPLTVVGKVKKFKMREKAVEMYGLQQSNSS